MKLHPIKNNKEYEASLKQAEKLMDARSGTKEADHLEVLSILIEKYEEEHFPMEKPTPVEAIKFRMEQSSMSRADLGKLIGGRSRASEILNYQRPLSLQMIRTLHEKLDIPLEVLVCKYPLKPQKIKPGKKGLAQAG